MIDLMTSWLMKAASYDRFPDSPVVCATDDELLVRETERVFTAERTRACYSLVGQGDGERDSTCSDGEAGTVVCFDAIARCGNTSGVMHEIDRLLLPGGLLLMIEVSGVNDAGDSKGPVSGQDTLGMLVETGLEIMESEVAHTGEAPVSYRINPDILIRYDRQALIPHSSPAFVVIARKRGGAAGARKDHEPGDKGDSLPFSMLREPDRLSELERQLEAKSSYLERLETYTRNLEDQRLQKSDYLLNLEKEYIARGEEIERESGYARKLENDIGWLQAEIARLSEGVEVRRRSGVCERLYLSLKSEGIVTTLKRSVGYASKRFDRKES